MLKERPCAEEWAGGGPGVSPKSTWGSLAKGKMEGVLKYAEKIVILAAV